MARDGGRRTILSREPAARAATATATRELLFEFHLERTHTFYRVELRDHGPVYGVEAQFFDPIDPRICRTFRSTDDPTGTQTPRQMAIAWAIEYWKAIESDDA